MSFTRLSALLLCALPFMPLSAHEFWIAPETYQVAPGASITAHFMNGEAFDGVTLSYFDRSSERFDTAFEGVVTPVAARAGDRPALQATAPEAEGLMVVLHETTQAKITYRDWAKFARFAAHKDFPEAEAQHDANNWPRENFRESYSRHAKALIAVGAGMGADQAFGLETEFVALSNPYAQDFDGDMAVRLLYQGAPRGDAQVEVFDRDPAGAVTVTLHRTDARGEARIPVRPGHTYLFDAVVLRPAPEAGTFENAPVWETLWAALTFSVPR